MKNYDSIYLAPHLDDAVLSCGGQIFEETRRGKRVLVVTLMAGDPPASVSEYAQHLHTRWQVARDAVAVRRQEDRAACAILAADTLHCQIADCIYRLHPKTGAPLYVSDTDIFGEVHATDAPLVAKITALLAGLPAAARVVAPLTVGHHVDHQLVRQAAERCFGHQLEFYEDYPYVQTPGSLDFLPQTRWQTRILSLSLAARQAKIKAILAYHSQVSTFFTSRADLEAQVFGYANAVGGERIWQKTVDQNTDGK